MSGYLGSIGFGFPAAMGAWAADRRHPEGDRRHRRRRLRPVPGRVHNRGQARHADHPRAAQQRRAWQDQPRAGRRDPAGVADRPRQPRLRGIRRESAAGADSASTPATSSSRRCARRSPSATARPWSRCAAPRRRCSLPPMARVTYVHWDEAEAHDVARRLIAGGHEVTVHWAAGEGMQADSVPEVLVVSLERLPSHGRAVAQWLWSAQYRRAIPIVFVGGCAGPGGAGARAVRRRRLLRRARAGGGRHRARRVARSALGAGDELARELHRLRLVPTAPAACSSCSAATSRPSSGPGVEADLLRRSGRPAPPAAAAPGRAPRSPAASSCAVSRCRRRPRWRVRAPRVASRSPSDSTTDGSAYGPRRHRVPVGGAPVERPLRDHEAEHQVVARPARSSARAARRWR